ncbi:MAG: gliding motility-associated-like protein [Sphingobacteriales bacterium]|jgi:gliding motility-associated-like protein
MKMKKTLLFGIILLLSTLIFNSAKAQTFAGLDFWVAFMTNASGPDTDFKHQLHITGDKSTKVTVTVPHAVPVFSVTIDIIAKEVTTVDLPVNPTRPPVGTSEIVEQRGVHVTSKDSVIVYAGNYKNYTSDAATAIPTNALGTSYDIIAYSVIGGQIGQGEFVLVATEDNTTIDINWNGSTRGGRSKGDVTQIVLNKGETYQAQTSSAAGAALSDLTGTTINADKKIAAFGGNTCTFVGGCGMCDHLYEQIRPNVTWGKNYFLATTRKASVSYDIVRVYAKDAGTTYTYNGVPFLLGAREFRDHDMASGLNVTSNNPIHLSHYLRGSACSAPPLEMDPLMLDVLPEEQFGSQYLFATSTYNRYSNHHLTVVIKTGEEASLRLNGNQPIPVAPGYVQIPGSDYSYGYVDLQKGKSYEMISLKNIPFGLYIYGYGVEEAYGFTAGGNLLNLNCGVIVKDTTLCAGNTAILTGKTKTNLDINWYDAVTGGNLLFTGNNMVTDPINSQTIFYAELDSSLCEDVRTPLIVNPEQPPNKPQVFGKKDICGGQSTSLTAFTAPNPAIKYGWFATDTSTVPEFVGTPFLTPVLYENTTYYVAAFFDEDCRSEFEIITINVKPNVPLPSPNLGCGTSTISSIQFSWTEVQGAGKYEVSEDGGTTWITPSSGETGLSHDYAGLNEGDQRTLIVRAIDVNSECAEGLSSLSISCIAKNCPGLNVEVSAPATITLGNPMILQVISTTGGSGNFAYEWDNGGGDGSSPVTITPNQTTTYTLTTTDLDNPGCPPAISSVKITVVEDVLYSVQFPNAFSPNGDGRNDEFKPVHEGIQSYQLAIFNRWGEKVYESLDPNRGWDGFYKQGTLRVKIGVYMYVASIGKPDGDIDILKGTITLTD